MSHEEYCEPDLATVEETNRRRARWIAGWPQGQPAEVDVATLPSAGAVTNPMRLIEEGDWLGVWGRFQGLRMGYSVTESFQVMPGMAVPYPEGVDIFLSTDSGSGLASFARFKSREAAQAWGGTMPTAPGKLAGGGIFSWAVDGISAPGSILPGVGAFPYVFSDRGSTVNRFRQPDAYSLRSIVSQNVSLAATGVVSGPTPVVNDGQILDAHLTTKTGNPTGAIVALQIIRSAVTYTIGSTLGGAAIGATLNQYHPLVATTLNENPMPGPQHLLASDQMQINVLTASGAASAADLFVNYKLERYVI